VVTRRGREVPGCRGLEIMMVCSNGGKAFHTVVTIIFKPVKKNIWQGNAFSLPFIPLGLYS